MFPNQVTISSLLEPNIKKDFVSVRKVIFWKFSKKIHVMFQAECVSNVYMLVIQRLQLVDCIAIIICFKIGGRETIRD